MRETSTPQLRCGHDDLFAFFPRRRGFWLYPLIQPLGRTLIGVWLWRRAASVT